MAKKEYWKIDNTDHMDEHVFIATEDAKKENKSLELFSFTVKRSKDRRTKNERITISVFIDGADYGSDNFNPSTLDADIVRFRAKGVMLSRELLTSLAHRITEYYYFFIPDETGNIDYMVDDVVTEQVVRFLCVHIMEHKITAIPIAGKSLYCIPVKDFNYEISKSAFKDYRNLDIKEGLCKQYTHCNSGKFDYVVKLGNGDTMKAVCLIDSDDLKAVLASVNAE